MKQDITAGKLPPQAKEIEEAVLGALLLDQRAIPVVMSHISAPDVFYYPGHQIIFKVIHDLTDQGKKVDLLTVSQVLRDSGDLQEVGGDVELVRLSHKVSSSAHAHDHCRILLDKYLHRQLIRMAAELLYYGQDPTSDVVDLFGKSQEVLNDLMLMATKGSRTNFAHWLEKAGQQILELSENPSGFSGCTLGINDLNELTGGGKPGELIILAGRPGMGKTAFAVRVLRELARKGDRAAFFSWEMGEESLVKRLMAVEADTLHANQFFQHGIRKPEYFKEFDSIMGSLEKLNDQIYIERSTANIRELRMKVMSLHKERPLSAIIVDYLQLIPGAGTNYQGKREQEVSEVSRGLKQIALELELPVIALSQLSREVEKRPTKRPMLSDLRESGSIEQDADLVLFAYRPSYYKIETWEDGSPCKDQAEIICAKQRNGKLGSVFVGFDSNRVKYCEISEVQPNPNNLKMLGE